MSKPHKDCSDDNTERPLIELIRTILFDFKKEISDALSALTNKEQERHEQIMTALETLTASVNTNTSGQADLTAAVNAAIVQLGTPGATDAQLLSLAAAIDQNTQSDAALAAALRAAVSPAPTP
jgi:hypothetical protein